MLMDDLENPAPSGAEARMQQFVGLLTSHERHIKSYILALVPNLVDAEQIAQETSLRLWQQFDQFDSSRGDFAAWSRAIARFQVLTFRKQTDRERVIFNSELVDALAAKTVAEADRLGARQAALIDCINRLPDHNRELIRLYYFAGMRLQAAAEQLGRTVAATEKAVARVRRVLYDCVQAALRREERA